MVFDSDKGDIGIVRDALGKIIFHPVSGDTETGRVVCCKPSGYQNEVEINERGVVRERHVYRAPLTISPVGDFKPSRYQGPWATPIYKESISGDQSD